MKRTHVYTGTKRSIVRSVIDGTYTIDQAARYVRVQPATVKRWLTTFRGYSRIHVGSSIAQNS